MHFEAGCDKFAKHKKNEEDPYKRTKGMYCTLYSCSYGIIQSLAIMYCIYIMINRSVAIMFCSYYISQKVSTM